MDARFKDILNNFKAIQDDNEAQAEAEKFSKWSWALYGPNGLQTNCLKSPDGRTVRHGHNGKSCNCHIRDDLLLSQYASGRAHIWITR